MRGCRAGALIVGLLLSSMTAARAADTGLTFYAPFDGSAKAAVCDSGSPEPTTARGLKFVPGVSGQAVYIGQHGKGPYDRMPLLEYDAAHHFAGDSGTVMFWVNPDWDGYFTDPKKFDWYFLFTAMGGKETPDFISHDIPPTSGYDRISLFMWNWLRCDLHVGGGKPAASLEWRCRNAWLRGDWWHIAFIWGADGQSTLYVNGMPHALKATPQLADIQRFYVGSLAKVWTKDYRANAAFDELKIYRRALTAKEIAAEFHRFAPLDFVIERRYLRAGVPEKFAMEVTPGAGVPTPVTGTLSVRILADADRHVVAEQRFSLHVSGRQTFTIPLANLPVGAYRAECVLTRGQSRFQRSFPLTVYRQREAPPVSRNDVKLGERTVSIDCTKDDNGFVESCPSPVKTVPGVGSYREAGAGKWDRFGFEVNVPGADGSPMMLEITWPDDRERAMSFYMIPKSASPQDRDRLAGGVQCGGEYPNTGTMQTARYLFYPAADKYLFEVRTLVPGLPAAAAKLEIYRLAERLPKLPILLPQGLPGRAFGHLDEDQSFEVLLGGPRDSAYPRSDLPYGYPVEVIEKLLDYMDYTGQNVMSYALARYTWTLWDQSPVNQVDDGLRTAGWIDLMLDMMARRDKQLIANIHLFTVPQQGTPPATIEECEAQGYFMVDRNGKVVAPVWGGDPGFGNNPAHPAVRARFLAMVSEILRRFGKHPAFKGIDLWCDVRTPCFFGSLDDGYGDLTVATFERETGIHVPGAAKPADRFAARYQFLTGPQRAKWLAWRAEKNTALLREIDAMVRRTRPDLQFYISIGGWYASTPDYLDREQCEDFDFTKFTYENLGLDLPALKRLPSVTLVPMKDGTYYRWLKHWYGGRENITNELNHDVDKFRVFRNGARSATSIYLRYFESFMKSLQQKTYPGYFQDSDPKATGRYFLQDFAVALASQDAAQILVGAQPLGTSGRDDEAREWASAYRALPVGDFKDIAGLSDPVTARFLNTKDGTYLYAVNLLWSPVTAAIRMPADAGTVMDLTTGDPVPLRGGVLEVALKPFQLRSFRCAGPHVPPGRGQVSVPETTREWYAAHVTEIAGEVTGLARSGADVQPQEQRLALLRRRIAEGRYADAHRLMVSKLVREMPALRQAAANGYLKEMAAMIARSEYAINCGSQDFYHARSGRLFFPDHKYTPGGYGYDGSYQSVTRPVAGLTGSDDPALFASEAYNLDAYRFTVKPGKYTVCLYLKVGYEPGAKPGVFVFNVAIDGKPVLSDFDLFTACDSNFHKAIVHEFKGVEVRNDVLSIEFGLPPGKQIDPTARLCDAIEVIPEP